MLLSMSSLDYFQCKSLLPECVVLTMIQKLLLLLLQGMIYFCSNAQRNVLLLNCCSKAANLLFFWCQEKWGMLALFFVFICITWAGHSELLPWHLCTIMGGTFLQGNKDGGFLPFLLRRHPGSGLEGTFKSGSILPGMRGSRPGTVWAFHVILLSHEFWLSTRSWRQFSTRLPFVMLTGMCSHAKGKSLPSLLFFWSGFKEA